MQISDLKIAVMQPYLFPYAGYFQLISAADTFVFYDDVNFIKAGWINRNRILINGEAKYFTVPCKKASQNRLINEIDHDLDEKARAKLLNKVQSSYGNAPNFEHVMPLFERVIYSDSKTIADLAITSIKQTMIYLKSEFLFNVSSKAYDNRELSGADRILDICKKEKATVYVNPIGGTELYHQKKFESNNVRLRFLQPVLKHYEQFDNNFVEGLSILDLLMFNSVWKVQDMLHSYKLIEEQA